MYCANFVIEKCLYCCYIAEQETGSHLEDMSSLSSKRRYELCGLIDKHFCAADLAYQIQGK